MDKRRSDSSTAIPRPISKKIRKNGRRGVQFLQESPAALSCAFPVSPKKFSARPKNRSNEIEMLLNLRQHEKESNLFQISVKWKTKVSEILQTAMKFIGTPRALGDSFQGDLRLMMVANDKVLPNEAEIGQIEAKFRTSKDEKAFVFGEKEGKLQVLWPVFLICDLNWFEENRHEFPFSVWKYL